jgi:pyrimidine-nucleoside phosphorylase
LIGPILAAAKVYTPMIGGRGLGHTGGTLDKYESIPGFKVDLSIEDFTKNIEFNYFSIMSQTSDICPADKKLYALRDITGTVESLPLICGSIMSKKLAENLTGLVLDIKCGSGAFMKTLEDAEQLAQLLKLTGEGNNVKVHALITNMNEVLGRFAGNALEVKECWDILCNEQSLLNGHDFYESTRELSLILSGHAIFLAEKTASVEEGIQMAREMLTSGRARISFENLLKYQGPSDLKNLPKAKYQAEVLSPQDGKIASVNTELIGLANIELGTGRKSLSDHIDFSAGIEVLFRCGDKVTEKQPLFRLYASNKDLFTQAAPLLLKSLTFGDHI